MISKKKVTALALAGLFVTPVLADTTIYKNNIQSSDGYLTAGDKLFSQALENGLQQGRRQTLHVGHAQRLR